MAMKKGIRILTAVLLTVGMVLPGSWVSAENTNKLFVTEICYNPSNSEGADYFEYIETVNPTDTAIDFRGGRVTYDSKSNSIISFATKPVQPGNVAVFAVYSTAEFKKGLKYDSREDFLQIIDAFNNKYGCSLDVESFYLIPKMVSGTDTVINNAFNLANTGTHSISVLSGTEDVVSIDTSYIGEPYDRNGYSVSYSLLDDGTSHLLGMTAAAPGKIIESRFIKRDIKDYSETIRFLDYNVLVAGGGNQSDPNDYVEDESLFIKNRSKTVFKILSDFDPDIFVLTEFNNNWWNELKVFIENGEGKYACYGHSDNGNNYNSLSKTNVWDTVNLIVYNKEKYDIIDASTIWIATNPERMGYELSYDGYTIKLHAPNSVNWVKFYNKTTGAEFGVLALHPFANAPYLYEINKDNFPDLTQNEFHELVRVLSARLIMSYMKDKVGMDIPFIISGDFNSKEHVESYREYLDAGFEDTRNLDRYATYIKSCPGLNYVTYSANDPYYITNNLPLDHILVSENHFTATDYLADTTKLNDTFFPSDHIPVRAVLYMKPGTRDYFELTDKSSYTGEDDYICMRKIEESLTDMMGNFKLKYRLDTDVEKIVGTGNIIWDRFNESDFKTFVVRGDLSGDGKLTSVDYLKLRQYFKGTILTPAQEKAGDYDENGSILSTDYLKLKSYFKGN